MISANIATKKPPIISGAFDDNFDIKDYFNITDF